MKKSLLIFFLKPVVNIILSLGSAPLQHQGMPGGQPAPHGPPRGAQPMQFNQQKGPAPSTNAHPLSNGSDQNTSHTISRETAEAEKVVNISSS